MVLGVSRADRRLLVPSTICANMTGIISEFLGIYRANKQFKYDVVVSGIISEFLVIKPKKNEKKKSR